MSVVIVINEFGDRIVMTTSHHARRSFLRREPLDVCTFVRGVGRVAADHFLVLAERNALPFQLLDILETGEDLVLDDELGLHLILAAFFDGEGLLFEGIKGAAGREIDSNVWPAFHFKCEGLDDAEPWIIRVGDGVAGADTKRGLPSVQSLVFLI